MSETEFAKTHLRDHLASLIVPAISQGLWSIYDSSKELCQRNEQIDQTIRTFQNMLSKVPEWSDKTLDTEVERIVKSTKCNYLDDLVMGVFIAYMKSFASLHYRGKASQISIDFDRPSLTKFVHHMYIHSARKLWQVAYLFKTVGTTSEVQARNRQEIEVLVRECMERVIHSFLPWESITKNLSSVPVEEDSSSDEEEPVVEEKKGVKFEEESESESEDEHPKLSLSEEAGTIDVLDFDEPKPEKVEKAKDVLPEDNALEEIEKKMSETLVLKL